MNTENTEKQTHTPGLWKFGGADSREIYSSEGHAICKIEFRFGRQDPTAQANARLIASAPDLLSACKAAIEVMELAQARAVTNTERNVIASRLDLVKSAIARAEGIRSNTMTVYTRQQGPETSFADLGELERAADMTALEEALSDPDFVAAGIQDIRGLVHNQPPHLYAKLESDGNPDGSQTVIYYGVDEAEVPENFFE